MISVEAWLKSFGFVRNPFETTEAAGEAQYVSDFLHQTFVKPQGFDEILGHPSYPKSSLVLAARGKGKTSARLMTAHFCREGIFPKEIGSEKAEIIRVLPIHHTHFERLVAADSLSALVNMHVIEILLRAVPALVNMLIHYPEISEHVEQLNPLRRLELQYFLVAFKHNVPLQEYKFARDILGKEIVSVGEARTLSGFSLPDHGQQKIGLSAQEIEAHLTAYSQQTPIDLLGRFAALMVDLGFGATYVLVDGVDEIAETADNFAAAAGLLVPLLSNLNLMTNTPYLAFKIFAPSEMETLLLEETRKVRRDRLAVQRIELREDDLAEILHRRLAYCSNNVISSMDAISSRKLRGLIEKELTSRAEGNPRQLALLGQYMLEHRCQVVAPDDEQEDYLLDQDDLEWAEHRLLGKPMVSAILSNPIEATFIEQPAAPSEPIAASIAGDWFRHELPAPIALSYLVYQRESVAHVRIWKMYELVESTLAFLSQVLLALLHQELRDKTSQQLRRSGLRLERTSMGIWRITLEKLPGMLAGLGIRSHFARACQSFLEKNSDFVQTINEERNRSAHGGPQPEKACEALIEQYAHPLQQYLSGLSFLRECHLVKAISVYKREDRYLHRCTSYVGDAPVFPTIDIELHMPLNSECLWCLSNDDPINLHPLILVTPSDQLGEMIWLYQGFDKEITTYKSYGLGQTLNISDYRQHIIGLVGQ
jgi:hypothetical protein